MYLFWKFVHLAGVVGFLLSHGVSVGVALKLRKERDPARIMALLDLSSSSITVFYYSFVVLLAGGIVTAFVLHVWTGGWIWISIGILVFMFAFMYAVGTTYYRRIRKVVTMRMDAESAAEDIASVSSSIRPVLLLVVGVAALIAIVYLMVYKPYPVLFAR